jgi:hypothetical protein
MKTDNKNSPLDFTVSAIPIKKLDELNLTWLDEDVP